MINPKLRRIYEIVGEATTIWNEVEELWYLIFTCLMRETERAKVDAIYDMFTASALQRQLVMKVAPIALAFEVPELKRRNQEHHMRRRLLRRVGQLYSQTNEISGRRNAVVHTAFEEAGQFQIGARSPHKPSKLRDEDHLKYLGELIQDTMLLVIELAELRDVFLDWIEPGARERRQRIMQQTRQRVPEETRQRAKEELLQAVARREQRPPQPSRR